MIDEYGVPMVLIHLFQAIKIETEHSVALNSIKLTYRESSLKVAELREGKSQCLVLIIKIPSNSGSSVWH